MSNVRALMSTSEQELRGRAERIQEAIRSGTIERAKRATLLEYSAWLATREATRPFSSMPEYAEICELVRLHLLRTFMEEIEKRGAKTQHIVVVLTILAIIGTGFQTWYGYRADKRSEEESVSTAQQRKSPQSLAPTLRPELPRVLSPDAPANPAAPPLVSDSKGVAPGARAASR